MIVKVEQQQNEAEEENMEEDVEINLKEAEEENIWEDQEEIVLQGKRPRRPSQRTESVDFLYQPEFEDDDDDGDADEFIPGKVCYSIKSTIPYVVNLLVL